MNQDNTLCGSVANLSASSAGVALFETDQQESNVTATDHRNAWLLTTPPLKSAEAGGEGHKSFRK